MASQPLVALGLQQPNIDPMGAYAEGQQAAAQADRAKMEHAQQLATMLGSGAMYALNGDINGEVDPQKYNEVLDTFEGMGVDVSKYRANPNFAKVFAQTSVSYLDRMKLAQSDRDFEFATRKFEQDIADADRQFGLEQEKVDLMRGRQEAADTPSGYRYDENGELAAIPGGPADPANPLNTKKVTGPNLSPTAQKELFEADESVQAGNAVISQLDRALEINDKAYSGPAAGARGYGGSLIGLEGGVATEELNNIITTQALDQLKATFGSMPTEGERKILLEIQGSVNQAPEVRKGIYNRAKALAEKRIKFNRDKAKRLRSGEYFTEQPGGDPADSGGDGGYTIEEVSP